MQSVIRELYLGNLFPSEQIVPKDREYRFNTKKIDEELNFWEKNMSKNDFARLESNLLEYLAKCSSLESEEAFCRGFKLGSLMIMEMFI